MKVKEIRKIEKKHGVKAKKKADLIHGIQKAEGNFDCFGSAQDYCDQKACMWRKDCLN